MSRIQTFNGIHVSQSGQTSVEDFELWVAPPHIRMTKMWGGGPCINREDRRCMRCNVCNIVGLTYGMW